MIRVWPSFVTKDLSPDDDAEWQRRWEAYDRDMRALIAAGGVHQDEDGWWVDDATGELIGPDPEIERPLAGDEPGRPFVPLRIPNAAMHVAPLVLDGHPVILFRAFLGIAVDGHLMRPGT